MGRSESVSLARRCRRRTGARRCGWSSTRREVSDRGGADVLGVAGVEGREDHGSRPAMPSTSRSISRACSGRSSRTARALGDRRAGQGTSLMGAGPRTSARSSTPSESSQPAVGQADRTADRGSVEVNLSGAGEARVEVHPAAHGQFGRLKAAVAADAGTPERLAGEEGGEEPIPGMPDDPPFVHVGATAATVLLGRPSLARGPSSGRSLEVPPSGGRPDQDEVRPGRDPARCRAGL
ncbi:hypothetical protein SCNRRL3882_7840 [Streptomyces chartreusis NRRL 3882]|uniref:Uncharacterized protein n=1 Tax=Streptomyces chartreusis NRRL 3882 TaxID=1079985 RepID=A0A2N9BM17_STRCX|nr:hypothetical protein SCNRRL3882_7840 [Streptomyces chartreusis NRRL 3882]